LRKDDRSFDRLPVPVGLESLSKRIDSTMWLSTQLGLLDRGKSSRMITSLKSELTAKLDDINSKTYDEIRQSLILLEQSLSSNKEELKRKTDELDQRPTREIVKYVQSETKSEAAPDGEPLVSNLYKSGFWLLGIILLIVLVTRFHF
jgi:hypothetical protein